MVNYVGDSVIGLRCTESNSQGYRCDGYRKARYGEIKKAHKRKTTISLDGCNHPKKISDYELKEVHRQLHSSKKLWKESPELMRSLDLYFGL